MVKYRPTAEYRLPLNHLNRGLSAIAELLVDLVVMFCKFCKCSVNLTLATRPVFCTVTNRVKISGQRSSIQAIAV